MRFSHTADCHIGGHWNPKLRKLTEEAFDRFVSGSIADSVDFCLVAGDLFNTAVPGIDTLQFTVEQLSRLKAKGIPVYAIPGSHDFSPSGRTMLDVLETAGLLVNVCKGDVENGTLRLRFTKDPKTGVKLTGILGKRGMLDRQMYEQLDRGIESEPGEKIFLFHTALDELKHPVPGQTVRTLPKNFLYYAGGHVHIVERYAGEGYENVVYPGPLFPNSFSELEELKHGGYWLYDNGELARKDIILKQVTLVQLDVNGTTSQEANAKLAAAAPDVKDAIVLVRIQGTLAEGTPGDIDIRGFTKRLEENGAYAVLRNTAALTADSFRQQEIAHGEQHDIEQALLERHRDELQTTRTDGVELAKNLMRVLGSEPKDGEKQYAYHERVVQEAMSLLK